MLYLDVLVQPSLRFVKFSTNVYQFDIIISFISVKNGNMNHPLPPFSVFWVRLKHDGTRAETRFSLSPKRTSAFKSAGTSAQSTTGSRDVRISGSNVGYTTFRGGVIVLATHSFRQFSLHFPSCASLCAIRLQNHSTSVYTFPLCFMYG